MSSPNGPPWVTRQGNHASCSKCGGRSEYRFMLWRSFRFTYWFWWRRFKSTHKRCLKGGEIIKIDNSKPGGIMLNNSKLDIIMVETLDALLQQVRACREAKHKRYSHDVIEADVRFRSLVCETCKKQFILERRDVRKDD